MKIHLAPWLIGPLLFFNKYASERVHERLLPVPGEPLDLPGVRVRAIELSENYEPFRMGAQRHLRCTQPRTCHERSGVKVGDM
jgi:hypothetical protein